MKSLFITQYQANILFAALQVLEAETETVLYSAGITPDEKSNNDLLTVLRMAEETKHLQRELTRQFNLPENK